MNVTPQEKLSMANKYAGCVCTLDGKPAKISGRLLPFARVAQIASALEVEFSWVVVDRIMREGGEFRS